MNEPTMPREGTEIDLHLEVKQLRDELEKLRADHAKALEEEQARSRRAGKLLKLRENDLRELQERYRKAIAAQERTAELFGQLEQRLRVAAGYFEELRRSPAPEKRRLDRKR